MNIHDTSCAAPTTMPAHASHDGSARLRSSASDAANTAMPRQVKPAARQPYWASMTRMVLGAACVWLAGMGVLYAGDGFTLAFCMGTAVVLGLAAKYLPEGGVDMLNLFLAAFTALYVAFDLRSDLWHGASGSVSDAALLANVTPVPTWGWAALWSGVTLVLLGLFARLSLRAAPPDNMGYGPQRLGRIR